MSKESCILCGKETQYEFDTHIDNRVGYIEGMGQLCDSCFRGTNDKNHVVIPEEYFKKYSNNIELGEQLRKFYYMNYK